ncbi:unnamed protein product [Brassica rapa subsp. trilocularis]
MGDVHSLPKTLSLRNGCNINKAFITEHTLPFHSWQEVKREDPVSQVVFPCDRRSQEETVGWPCEEEDKRLFPCERRSQAETVVSPCDKRQFATCVS